jgi:hypothetical protein
MEDALQVASSPHDFKLLVAADGRTQTSMDDLNDSTQSLGPNTVQRAATAPTAPAASMNGH